MESKIIEFSETMADMEYSDERGSVYDAERAVTEVVTSLDLHVILHNLLMRVIDRYREICEKAVRDAAKGEG